MLVIIYGLHVSILESIHVPYSGKFLFVQICFINSFEEVFIVLNFCARTRAYCMHLHTIQNFVVLIFAVANLSTKNT